ncbi:biliverdin-producing heme oxygenase [Aeromicrobium sp. SMF47]|uniref:Biliverdin-producing heme oxygenase n=1 Tax=Aeromicrobium yanjiei TaxID=2662028 RepID=A0A5Q2MHH1_9ACTN|nr:MULTISPECIES: biliverdin-producing heme oxygenase [Aeromicrobium]MRJ75016.1 biliverdin-producing heme oxygenase [Aeromicrobium yanjiei]MRK02928.1 biliverdin-producing heme oxygenase [Aeromicrobium sp. S22]QGG40492.1 biliverdin-producing heme oxygenase [Aeromicrobium yanjiei]
MTVTAENPATSLSALLRTGSQAEHTAAEGSTFMSELMAGRINEAGYAHFLGLMRRVYEALEETAQVMKDDPLASSVIDPAIERLGAIDADIQHWGDPRRPSPATDAYVARIRASTAWGGLFIAHHYTRYMGDLSGGQAIGRIISREFGLDGAGVAFYAFDAVPKPKLYKDAYRARLDALPLDPAERERVLAEVKAVFALNGGLFAEMTTYLDEYAR